MKSQIVNRGSLFSFVTVFMMLFALQGTTYGEAVFSIDPAAIESPAAGEQLTVDVNISAAAGITAYQFDVLFDPTALSYVGVEFSDYLPGAFPVSPNADEIETNPDTGLATIRMASLSLAGEGGDMGTLVTITFEVVEAKDSSLQIAEVQVPDPADASLQTLLAVTTTDGMVSAPAAPVDETPVDETPVDETPVDETPVDETPVDETPVDETPVDETPVDETPVDETPVDETPVDETPVDETPVDETPVDETPVDETPVDETPVDETPVDETPVDETPVDETPVDETPVDETPVDETPVDETPVDETPVDETPVDETPVDETPVDETLIDEMPTEESAAAPPIEADQTFTVTLENLTVGTPTESGQIFSPALFITHTSSVSFVEAGTAASEELRDIAEMGDNAPLSALAMGTEGVKDVQSAEGVLLPGASTSVMIDGGMDGWLLSFASMLVQTNDALVAGNSLSLFDEAGAPRTFTMDIMTYDAGTEENNELATHVPGPPFGGSEQAVEGGVIMAHPGITGNADVGMEFGWMEPVARLSVAPYVAPPEEEMATFAMMLDEGLNMISLPLMPEAPFTAQTFAEAVGATVVIKLDAASQNFVGFTAGEGGDGFAIEGGKGYIVNTPDGGSVTFTGMAWDNQPVAAAPGINPFRDAWAFVVSGSLQNADPQTNYTLVAKNLRTGAVATEPISTSKTRSAAVWADLNRNSVIEAGDQLEITVVDGSGNIVSGPFTHTVDIADIRQAYLRLSLVVGDVHPEQTRLAQNFPNPFNPETWMPFQLSESSFASIQIYSASGQLVRTLDLGMKPAGFYMTRSNAAYWDGRNGAGEHVASGVYFYTLNTDNYAATRKMLISK